MTDYISRGSALAFQCEVEPVMCKSIATGEVFSATPDAALVKFFNSLPAADVRPVVRGEWEEVEVSYIEDMYDKGNLPEAIVSMYCPICERYHNEVYWYGNPTENINFCPNCGADMRAEEGE